MLSIHLHSILSPELLNPSSSAGAAQRALLGLAAPLPTSASKPEWGALLAGLPEADAPAAFGLPANIDKVVALAAGGRLTAALRQLSTGQVRPAGGGTPRVVGDSYNTCMLLQLMHRCWTVGSSSVGLVHYTPS